MTTSSCTSRARKTKSSSGRRKKEQSTKKESALSKAMVKKRHEIKSQNRKKRKEKKVVKTWRIDYSKLDSKGVPSISFDPKSTRRDELIAILEAPTWGKGISRKMSQHRKEAKEKTEAKLGREFARIYKRYRNLVQDARDRKSRFELPPSSEKYCVRIAIQCIYQQMNLLHL